MRALLFVTAFLATSTCYGGFTFTPLGTLPGGTYSSAQGISQDGTVVVGFANSAGTEIREAFRWTAATGLVGLGTLPGGPNSSALDVSADGSVIVGSAEDSGGNDHAYRWTESTGMETLGYLPNGAPSALATDVSADGSVVVGTSGFSEAFRWTSANGMQGIGTLTNYLESRANAISADGSVIVGHSSSDLPNGTTIEKQAYRWTVTTGMEGLGIEGGYAFSEAVEVSADGTVIIGNVLEPGAQAFRWTEETGISLLGFLPGAPNSTATAMSADGSVIVGASDFAAFFWTESTGMVDLQEMLEADGIDLDGWLLYAATGVSADGSRIAGFGLNPSGRTEAFIVTVPETSSLFLITLGLAAISVGHLRSRRFHV